jgi:hypothetical protein
MSELAFSIGSDDYRMITVGKKIEGSEHMFSNVASEY